MISKKKLKQIEGTPFADLVKGIENPPEPIDLESKIRTFESKRDTRREFVSGSATLCDSRKKKLTTAEFKNLSPTGVSLEIRPIPIKPKDDLYILFDDGISLGLVLCTVQWVVNIEGHRRHHKLVGFKFKNLSTIRQQKLNDYLDKLKLSRNHDPFYGG